MIYDAVMQAIADENGCFFVDGPGGTGKTFLYNTLLATIRSSGEIAVAVRSLRDRKGSWLPPAVVLARSNRNHVLRESSGSGKNWSLIPQGRHRRY